MNDSTERLLRNAMQSSYNTGKTKGFALGIVSGVMVVFFAVTFSMWIANVKFTLMRDGKVIDRSVCP